MYRSVQSIVLLSCLVFVSPAPAQEAETADDNVVREGETQNTFRGVLHKVWSKLRTLSPTPEAERAGRGQMVVTAGIRGAESTESTLKPYWKDDRSRDEAFLEQVRSLNAAHSLVDEGRLQEALGALETFIDRYPDSDLLPNAIFARGLTQSVNGDAKHGIETLKRFIESYPDHPLKQDAELAIAEIDSSEG